MSNFTDDEIEQVWKKGTIVKGVDPTKRRKDQCGAWIKRSEYGNRDSDYGWECDHIKPTSKGGEDWLSNIRPLQWENNASRQEGRLKTVVTAEGDKNIKNKKK